MQPTSPGVGLALGRSWVFLFCCATLLRAQYPPETRWRKIETAHFDVVFPREITGYAQQVANTLEVLYKPLAQSLAAEPKRTTVLLINQGVTRYNDGYVSLFPREAVFDTMPAQGFWGANEWSSMLSAREGSYLVQIEKMGHGMGKLAKALFGESGRAAVIGMTLPVWSIEGQARDAETTLTGGGVGQFASAEAATRAVLLSGRHDTYMKAMHGSYRDYVPDQAELGSLLVSHVNRIAGADAWNQILAHTAKNGLNPFALSIAMKQVTGRTAAENYSETMSEVAEKWNSQAQPLNYSRPQVINTAPRKAFTGYFQPVFEADGSVLAQKSGLDTYPVELVRIRPDGSEQRLGQIAPAVNGSNRTSTVNGKLVLDEYVPDLRWRRGYTEILIRDVSTGRTRRLTHHSRFMNPVLAPDGARIAVVEFLPDRSCSLVILSAETGNELRRLHSPGDDMIYSPAWSEDGRRVAMVAQGDRGRALRLVDLESGKFDDIIPAGMDDLANPVFFRGYLLYTSSYDGIVNIYALEIATGRRYRVTESRFGASFPTVSPDGSRLLYSDYTAAGYNLAELPLDPSSWVAMNTVARGDLNLHGPYHDYPADASATQYPVEPYRPSRHLFGVHSWGPTSGPPDLGLGLISNDKMGLMNGEASIIYNTNERTTGFATNVSYNRFYPVLDFSVGDRERRIQFVSHQQDWIERSVSAGFHVPLNLSRGFYNTSLSFGASLEEIHALATSLMPMNFNLNFRRQRQSSARDLWPVWGQALRFSYRESPWHEFYSGNFLSADGRLLLPGLARHHSVRLEGGYERENGNYYFSSQILFPRGYNALVGPNLTKFSGSYAFPLLYPDRGIGQLLFVKRVSGNLFYDYGKVAERLYRSTGAELLFDLGVLHFPVGLRFGMRYARLLDYSASRVQPFVAYGW